MKGCGETDWVGGGGRRCERKVLRRWRMKAGLRRMAGTRYVDEREGMVDGLFGGLGSVRRR